MRKAVISGSFDPITLGHLDIINRASNIVDELVIVVAVNPNKKTMFSIEERIEIIKSATEHLNNISVDSSEKLIVDYCEDNKIDVIIRGVRNIQDYTYEQTMAIYNSNLNNNIETICLFAKANHAHISSSGVKELIKFNRGYEELVPRIVVDKVRRRNEDL